MNLFIKGRNKVLWEYRQLTKKIGYLSDSLFKGIKIYKPVSFETPSNLIEVRSSAWKGLEKIIGDIIVQSNCGTDKCLEFGVEFGYSTVVFSNYFKQVTGVDIFTGDPHAGFHGDIYEKVKSDLKSFQNIKLIQSDYKDFIADNDEHYNLIHVDIVHTYEATYDCGLWSAMHSKCTLFHDTESFPEVKSAVLDIARRTGKKFYNYPSSDGLGIIY